LRDNPAAGLDAAIHGSAVHIASKDTLRTEHSGQPMVSFGPRRRHAPVDGDTTQSGHGRHSGAGAYVVREGTGTGNQSVGASAQRFGDNEIQGTNLIAAECKREEIVALEPQL
jgi:hypothetical protein